MTGLVTVKTESHVAYIEVITNSVVRFVRDVEKTYNWMVA